MRIVSRAELRRMPVGTLYAELYQGHAWPQGPTDVFLGDFEGMNDFVCSGLGSVQSSGSNQLMDREHEMSEAGAEYPLDIVGGRDGLFDDTMRYLVWDVADVAVIVAHTAWFDAGQGEWNGTVRYRIRKADGTFRYGYDEDDARRTARPGDTIERLFERHHAEWRPIS